MFAVIVRSTKLSHQLTSPIRSEPNSTNECECVCVCVWFVSNYTSSELFPPCCETSLLQVCLRACVCLFTAPPQTHTEAKSQVDQNAPEAECLRSLSLCQITTVSASGRPSAPARTPLPEHAQHTHTHRLSLTVLTCESAAMLAQPWQCFWQCFDSALTVPWQCLWQCLRQCLWRYIRLRPPVDRVKVAQSIWMTQIIVAKYRQTDAERKQTNV